MPSTSKKQHRFMEAVAHNEKFAKKVGVPMSVGKDFSEADKGRKFGTGGGVGITRGGQKQINKQVTRYGSVLGNEKNVPNINLNKYIGKKEGGMATKEMKKLFKGKETYSEELKEAKAIKSGKITPEEYAKGEKMEGHKKGGKLCMAKGGQARATAKGMHPVQKRAKEGAEIVKMAKGGLAAGHKSADGIAVRGKTRGTQAAMCGGGMAKGKK